MAEQQSSPSRVAGLVAREVSVGGVTYLLSEPNKIRTSGDEEKLVIGRRLAAALPAAAKACADLPPDQQRAWREQFAESFISGIASRTEWKNYYDSLWWNAFRFWCALDVKHKLDPADRFGKRELDLLSGCVMAHQILSTATEDEMDAVMASVLGVSQSEEVGN